MTDLPRHKAIGSQPHTAIPERSPLSLATIRHRLGVLKWLMPLGLLALVLVSGTFKRIS
ncbi:MAG TPA: hypothetical protein VJ020_05620 [Anaerolineales bacterium]|nr:hypothetical protein [Anaerolineales bacterium]